MPNIPMDGTSKDRNLPLNVSPSPIPDTEQMLLEASSMRARNIAGAGQPSDASTALDALNNIFKAFNTVAELGNSQSVEETEPSLIQESSVEPESVPVVSSEKLVQAKVVVKAEDVKPTEPPPEPVVEKVHEPAPVRGTDLSKRVQSKLWFTPAYHEDQWKVDKIKEIKSVLSSFQSYDDMVSYINGYIDQGNVVDSELFFLFHNIYTLDRPERFYQEFRGNVFSDDRLVGGKSEDIEQFLSSVTAEPVAKV